MGNGRLEIGKVKDGNAFSITYNSGDNETKLIALKKFHEEHEYKPNTLLLGITAPTCNLNCEFCLRKYNAHFNTPETDINELRYMLDMAMEANVNITLVFFNNEVFNAENLKWQQDIAGIIEEYKDEIKSIMFFTNGIDLHDEHEHPLLTYATEVFDPEKKKVKVCLAVNVDQSDTGESHITIHNDYRKYIDYISKYVTEHFEINLLYDIVSDVDYIALEEFLSYIKNNGLSLKISAIIRETSSRPTVDIDRLSDLFAKYETGMFGKLTGIYSQFTNHIPVPIDGPPNYAVVNNKSLRGITSGKEYKIETPDDILGAMDRYIFEAFPAFDKCRECVGDCTTNIEANTCSAHFISKCRYCPIFPDCSGFFCEGNMPYRPCDIEVFDTEINLAAKLKTILKDDMTREELKQALDDKLLNKSYSGLINKSFRRK
jgi:hypothetical protein